MSTVPFVKSRACPKRLSGMKKAMLGNDGVVQHIVEATVLTVQKDYKKTGQWRVLLSPDEARHHVAELAEATNAGTGFIPIITEWVPEDWEYLEGKPQYWAPPGHTWDSEKDEFVKVVKPVAR